MKKLTIKTMVLTLLLAFSCALSAQTPDAIEKQKAAITALLNKGDCDGAQAKYDRLKKTRNYDSDIEKRIADCKNNKSAKSEPTPKPAQKPTPKPAPKPTLDITPQTLSFAEKGGSKSVTVNASSGKWNKPYSQEKWVTLSTKGNTVTVTVSANTNTQKRSTSFKVVSGNLSKTVSITQDGAKKQNPQPTKPKPTGGSNTTTTPPATSSNAQTFTVKGVTFKMIRVQGGTFRMGCTSEQGNDCHNDESPAHSVTLSDYYIGETEVTQELWQAVMGSNPSYFKGSDRPVESVSWDDCQKFIQKLNALTGRTFRLPTEAEWEYAARGGRKSQGYKYSGSNILGNVAWYGGNSGSKTHPVKTKNANELGIYDMSGNVWEWCQDWYGSYSGSSQTNPKGPSSGSYRVDRGGCWIHFAGYCRVSIRSYDAPDDRDFNIGFRLAL